ncbi:MAG: carbohydrate kinase family protein [Verrucomicrobiota bacterium]|jgi:sugar/nucleoside kinase (ribokinase family)|nr:carbohydrate kinase family protein [Verrucomicrobiota bacterium]
MATDLLILNTAVLDLRSPDFAFADRLAGAGGLAKCATADMPPYSQEQLQAYVARGCATAGGPGNTAPLAARAGLRVAVGVNLGRGGFGGLDIQGRTFHDALAATGVDLSAALVHPALPTGTTFIHEAPGGERGGIVYFPNANNDFDFEAFKPHVARLAPAVVYYMYSGLSDRGDARGGRDLAAFMAWCRGQGAVTVADSHTLTGNPQERIASGRPVPEYRLLEPLLGEVDIFFTSADEARMIRRTLDPDAPAGGGVGHADTRADCASFLDFAVSRFSGQGRRRAQLFGITVKNGAYVRFVGPDDRARGTVFCASRFMVGGVVDLVGAGDSFRAGLTAAVARSREAFLDGTLDVEEAVQLGNLMATLYVTSPLADRYGHIPAFEALQAVVRSGRSFETTEALLAALAEGAGGPVLKK